MRLRHVQPTGHYACTGKDTALVVAIAGTTELDADAGWPTVLTGHTSTWCACRVRSSYRTTIPPTLPDPDADDQMMFDDRGLFTSEVVLLRAGVAQFRDVPVSEQPATDCRTRFTAAHDWAVRHGFQHGFPNFHAATKSTGAAVYGTLLIPHRTATFSDVPCQDLGLPDMLGESASA